MSEDASERYRRIEAGLLELDAGLERLIYGSELGRQAAGDLLRSMHARVDLVLQDLWPLMGPVCDWCGRPMGGEPGSRHPNCRDVG